MDDEPHIGRSGKPLGTAHGDSRTLGGVPYQDYIPLWAPAGPDPVSLRRRKFSEHF